jgi:hypothetical protein
MIEFLMPTDTKIFCERPSRLVATAAEDRLSHNPHTSFVAASDCRAIAIYETP